MVKLQFDLHPAKRVKRESEASPKIDLKTASREEKIEELAKIERELKALRKAEEAKKAKEAAKAKEREATEEAAGKKAAEKAKPKDRQASKKKGGPRMAKRAAKIETPKSPPISPDNFLGGRSIGEGATAVDLAEESESTAQQAEEPARKNSGYLTLSQGGSESTPTTAMIQERRRLETNLTINIAQLTHDRDMLVTQERLLKNTDWEQWSERRKLKDNIAKLRDNIASIEKTILNTREKLGILEPEDLVNNLAAKRSRLESLTENLAQAKFFKRGTIKKEVESLKKSIEGLEKKLRELEK